MMYDKFTHMYKLSKTLRFSLKPQGETLRYMEERGILEEDKIRAEEKKNVQVLADRYHKAFIDRVLSSVNLNLLAEYVIAYKKGEDTSELAESLIKQISAAFAKDKEFGTLFKAEMYKEILPTFYADDEKALASLSFFDGFATYFTGYNKNREFIYNASGDKGTIGNRLINENLPKAIDNNRKLLKALDAIDFKAAEKELSQLLCGKPLDEFFDPHVYNNYLTQKGIDAYNQVIGGYSLEDGTKIRGLNEYISMYNQSLENKKDRLPLLTQLYKQVLSERTTASFRPEPFTSDNEVLDAIKAFDRDIKASEDALVNAVLNLENYDLSGVLIRYDALKDISNKIFDSWRFIYEILDKNYDDEMGTDEKTQNTKSYKEKKSRYFKTKNLAFSVKLLDSLPGIDGKVSQHLKGAAGFHKLTIEEAGREMLKKAGERSDEDRSLKRDKYAKSSIKAYLDSLTEFRRFMAIFMVQGAEKDDVFYADIEPAYHELSEITPLYNKTRNYLSGKLYTNEKIKLNFGSSVLLDGWSESVEKVKLGTILIKDGRYFLGIIAKGQGDLFAKLPDAETDDVYKKMRYNLISGANKSLPHVIFSKKGVETFKPSAEVMRIYKGGTFKKGKDFSLEDCHKLIDFFKECIAKIPSWDCYNFDFSETSTYEDISGFYHEVERGGYSLKFRDIDASVIDNLVSNGQLYLFEIWHKDFSEHAKGKPDLSTLYWRAIFDPRNEDNLIYKLNGGAEIFYRKASIKEKDIIRHKAGDIVKAKNPLTENKTRTLEYDIIKDRRFTMDHFQLNVPITLNASSPDFSFINTEARLAIKKADNPHVIGVSRGENSLIYITVLDSKGSVVEERSLNKIGNTDYADLLARREAERMAERKSWESVQGIKQLKDGYIGQVVRVLADLMIKYDAVIAIEDISAHFKQSRQKIEKAVYQQLEEKLIKKLNFLVNKDAGEGEIGEPMLAYQLTGDFQGFDRIGKQTGFIFYVSPWDTTAIDPATGYVNMFDTRYSSVAAAQKFWHSFDNITFDEEQDAYRFDFDYTYFVDEDRAKMLEGTRTKWSIYAKGERLMPERTDKGLKWQTIDIRKAMDAIFEEYDIGSEADLRGEICAVSDKSFHEQLLKLFGLAANLRNGSEIISPVMDMNGGFCRVASDYNGAYNIARKGLMLIDRIKASSDEELSAKGKDGIPLTVSKNEWLKNAQRV